jgi:hypothetical protein
MHLCRYKRGAPSESKDFYLRGGFPAWSAGCSAIHLHPAKKGGVCNTSDLEYTGTSKTSETFSCLVFPVSFTVSPVFVKLIEKSVFGKNRNYPPYSKVADW